MLLDLAMRSGMPWNTTGFSDSEIDALLAEVEAEIDVEARRPLMGRPQARMQDVGPIVQPSWLSVVTVMSERRGGFRLHPTTLLFAEDYLEIGRASRRATVCQYVLYVAVAVSITITQREQSIYHHNYTE